jgi:hypothetical protein
VLSLVSANLTDRRKPRLIRLGKNDAVVSPLTFLSHLGRRTLDQARAFFTIHPWTMGASEKGVSKSTRSVRDRHSVREPGDGDLSAPTAASEAVAFEKTTLPPATGTASGKPKTERRLLRKSSSASLLDVEGTADDPGAHKLRRKSSSLRDLTAEEAATLKEKHDPRKASRKSKRSDAHATALPPLTPKTGRDHTSQVHSEYQPRDRPKRRKRAGDIELQRQPTIRVVVKYQCTSRRLITLNR